MAVQTLESAPPATAPGVRDDPTAFVLGGSGGLRRRAAGAVGTWLGLAVVAVLVAIPLRGLYRFTGGTMEEGFMLYFPERIARGDVPNVDFLHLYGPGSLQVLTGWYGVFGHNLAAERTFGLLQHVGILLALFTLARAWGRLAATAVAALAVFYVLTPDRPDGDGLERRPRPHAVERGRSSLRGVAASRRDDPGRRRWAWVAAGVLAGLALTYRPDLVIAVAPAPRLGVVEAADSAAARAARRRRRARSDVGAPRDGRAGRRLPGHGHRPGVPPAGGARAAPPAVVGPPRRWPAGGRRRDPAVVEVPPPHAPRTRCSCGSS